MSMEDVKGLVPIRKVFLRPNHRFALEFREGYIFGQIIKRRICEYRPWSLVDANGDTVDIAANSAYASEVQFRDPRGSQQKDMLYLDGTTGAGWPWFYHGSFGIWPPSARMYLHHPEAMEIPGKFSNLEPIRPQQGDDLGYVDYENSPYLNPSDHVETVIPPLTHIGAEFYNLDDDDAINPILHILFALYFAEIYTPETHPSEIANIASGARAKFLQVGYGNHAENMDEQLMRDWKVEPMTLSAAARLDNRVGDKGGRF